MTAAAADYLDKITNGKTNLDKLYGLVNMLIQLEDKKIKNKNQKRLIDYLETIRTGLDAIYEEENKDNKVKD